MLIKYKIKVDRAVMSCYIACTLTLNALVNAYFWKEKGNE